MVLLLFWKRSFSFLHCCEGIADHLDACMISETIGTPFLDDDVSAFDFSMEVSPKALTADTGIAFVSILVCPFLEATIDDLVIFSKVAFRYFHTFVEEGHDGVQFLLVFCQKVITSLTLTEFVAIASKSDKSFDCQIEDA